MFVLDLCNNVALIPVFEIVQRVLLVIQIIAPIVLIVSCTIDLIKLMTNPEAKGGNQKIINKFIAAAVIFMIPVLIDATMSLIGENTKISSCWNRANTSSKP